MKRAFIFSVLIHTVLFIAVYWSTEISLAIIKKKERERLSGVIQVDLLYKPTDTPVRQGKTQENRLPPPKVATKKKEEPKPKLIEKAKPKPVQPKPKPAPKEEPKKDFRNLFEKMRQETGLDREKPPREDNFLTKEDGEKDSTGTGGESQRKLSPGQMALQAAASKYAQTPQAERMRKLHPDARGYIEIELIGIGNQLKLVSLNLVERSGVPSLDQGCEIAIRKALQEEVFANDIIQELSGKEHIITCQF